MDGASGLEYVVEPTSQKAVSRFGVLQTSRGNHPMPTIAPSVRTNYDARALVENLSANMSLATISVHLSYSRSYVPILSQLLGRGYDSRTPAVFPQKPLVIPDPESEALSFNCLARGKYLDFSDLPASVQQLMKTKLTGNNAHYTWKRVRKEYGLTTIKDWLASHHAKVGADVFLAPSPIIRKDPAVIAEAFECAYGILDEARADFQMSGIHLLIHGEVFGPDETAAKARVRILDELDSWIDPRTQHGTSFLSLKLHDGNRSLTEPSSGSLVRLNLSEFMMGVSERTRKAKGVVIGQNFDNLCLGILESGADVATFRISGKMRIDLPVVLRAKSSSSAQKEISEIFDRGTLAMSSVSSVRRSYDKNGGFPTPSCAPPSPFWNLPYGSQAVYACRVKCGALVEQGIEYRDAGMDNEILLKEAVRSMVMRSEERQLLIDLCPSLSQLNPNERDPARDGKSKEPPTDGGIVTDSQME